MRRWIWFLVVVAALGAAYWAWPLAGAASLASAARRGDSAALLSDVDLPALRRSLARQIALAYLKVSGKGGKPGSIGSSLVGAAATSVADPYLDDLLTPENLTALLGQGKVGTVTLGGKPIVVDRDVPSFASLLGSNWLSMLTSSYFDGLTSFVIPAETSENGEDDFAVHLHLAGLTWQLSGVDLPRSMVEQIARSILDRNGAPGAT